VLLVDQDEGRGTEHAAASNTARNARRLAIAALVISILAPFGADALFGTLNIHTPGARRLAETSLVVDRLERQSAELEKQLATATTQLAALQAQSGQAATRAEASQNWTRTMALVELGAALRHPGAFDLELAMVRTSGAAPAEFAPLLAKVEPYSATGIPGLAQLQRDFSSLRSRIEWVERSYMPVTWMNKLIAWPRGAATSHPVEPPPQDTTGKLLTEAAGELARDNLSGAVLVAQKVTGPNRDALTDWVEDAGARVAADDLARRINDLVVQQRLSAKSATRP